MSPFFLKGPIPIPPAWTAPRGRIWRAGALALNLEVWLLPESSFQIFPFCVSFIAASSLALSTLQRGRKGGSPPRSPQRPSWDNTRALVSVCRCTYDSLLLKMPACSVLFYFVLFKHTSKCISCRSHWSMECTVLWSQHWHVAWPYWYLVIGNRSWHFNRLQWVILHSPFLHPQPSCSGIDLWN